MSQPSVKFQIRLPDDQRKLLRDGIAKDPLNIVKSLVKLDASKAQAAKQDDKHMIFDVIERTVGFSAVRA